jgi:hypothetical protein
VEFLRKLLGEGPAGLPAGETSGASRLGDDRFVIASVLFELLNDLQSWVYRKVETVEILEPASLHRRVSVDLRVPRELPSGLLVDPDLLPVTPLGFLGKEVLRRFDLRDDAGSVLPLLTKEQNGPLAHDILIAAAEARLLSLDDEIARELELVATGRPAEASAVIASWRRAARDESAARHPAYAQLCADEGFMTVASALATEFVLCVDRPAEPGERRVFKFAYESEWGRGKTRRERIANACGWRWMAVDVDAPQAHLARSYHLEVFSGTDVDIGAARLAFSLIPPLIVADEAGPEVRHDPQAPPPRQPVIDRPAGTRAHVYCAALDPGVRADATVWLRARMAALPAWAFGIALFLTLLLIGGGIFLDDITAEENSQVAAALILLVPTFVAASLIQPGEHRLVTALLWGVRALLAGTIIATVVAVSVLAGVAACAQGWVWWSATAAAAAFTVALGHTVRVVREVPDAEVAEPAGPAVK